MTSLTLSSIDFLYLWHDDNHASFMYVIVSELYDMNHQIQDGRQLGSENNT